MNAPSSWQSPRRSIEQECARRGRHEVVAGCIDLLNGGEADDGLVLALGGPPARWILDTQQVGSSYWPRVWAARGLLWTWDDVALASLVRALADDSWRVREMALKVVARHRVDEALTAVAACQDDPVPRVRSAAARALLRLTVDDA